MSEPLWNAVDHYLCDMLVPSDAGLDAALTASVTAGLPAINIAPNQGKLLHILAMLRGARRILEIGTLGGYSTIWLARALPEDGSLISLELDPRHAEVARTNLATAGVADRVEVRVGPALDSLAQLTQEQAEPFDLTFIDADKPSNADYFKWAVSLSRPGSVIIVDNVVRDGQVADMSNTDPAVVGARRLFDAIAGEPRVVATAVQTVGSKGHDGFALAMVTSG
jgi:predicted O-methyltransferase YrrM